MIFNKILSAAAGLLLLAGCDYNERYFDGLDDAAAPTDVISLDKTLTDDDYEAIATNATNVKLAGSEKKTALEALKKNGYFTEQITPEEYLPAYFAALYPGADDKSAIRVTYRTTAQSDIARTINHAATYELTLADYTSAWGCAYPFFAPSITARESLPAILAKAFPDAKEADGVYACYHLSMNEPSGAEYALDANFEDMWHQNITKVSLAGWTNLSVKGSNKWDLKAFRGNNYIQASANENKGEMEVYMITPAIVVKENMEFSFDACYGNYKEEGGRIQVLLTSDLSPDDATVTLEEVRKATWHDITSSVDIPVPSETYGTLANACRYGLSDYAGKTIRIAFLYKGDESQTESESETVRKQATTTVQIDNVSVRTAGFQTEAYTVEALPYRFDGSVWQPYTEGLTITSADMTEMGSKTDFFSSTMNPQHYLPLFLRQKYVYPTPEESVTVIYKYYGATGQFRADDYQFDGTNWLYQGIVSRTAQFVKNNGKWLYDPNVDITLPPLKGNPTSTLYYQTICDWVGANKGVQYYQSGFTNAEYYYGASAYQCNMDFKIDSWRSKCSADYSSLSDKELEELQFERLKEAFLPALEKLHADAQPIEGMEVLYSIRFGLFTDTTLTNCNYVIVYRVSGKGQFEFESMNPIEKKE